MIQQGVPFKVVTKEYKKQFGKPLSRSTYFDWKKNTEEIINSGASSSLVRTSYTLSDIRNQFDEDLLAEIEKTTQDVEGIVGISIMAAKLAATPKYQEEDQIQSLTFHHDFCKRIIRIHNLRVTSSLSTMLVMTKSEEEISQMKFKRPKLKKIKFRQVSCLFSKKKFLPSNSNFFNFGQNVRNCPVRNCPMLLYYILSVSKPKVGLSRVKLKVDPFNWARVQKIQCLRNCLVLCFAFCHRKGQFLGQRCCRGHFTE